MKEIKLTQGKVALVDDEDYEWLSQWKWHAVKASGRYYAARACHYGTDCNTLFMHRFIMNNPQNHIDHVDGNGLHNYRANLRKCTVRENSMNRFSNKNSSSKYKGVSWNKKANKWFAQIRHMNKQIYLGAFTDECKAAKAYDRAAKKYFKNFARFNFNQKITGMRTIDKIITKCDCKYGAPMGRPNIGEPPLPFIDRIYDCLVPMLYSDGAYDKGGAYWGIGNELRVSYTKDLSYIHFYRKS